MAPGGGRCDLRLRETPAVRKVRAPSGPECGVGDTHPWPLLMTRTVLILMPLMGVPGILADLVYSPSRSLSPHLGQKVGVRKAVTRSPHWGQRKKGLRGRREPLLLQYRTTPAMPRYIRPLHAGHLQFLPISTCDSTHAAKQMPTLNGIQPSRARKDRSKPAARRLPANSPNRRHCFLRVRAKAIKMRLSGGRGSPSLLSSSAIQQVLIHALRNLGTLPKTWGRRPVTIPS